MIRSKAWRDNEYLTCILIRQGRVESYALTRAPTKVDVEVEDPTEIDGGDSDKSELDSFQLMQSVSFRHGRPQRDRLS